MTTRCYAFYTRERYWASGQAHSFDDSVVTDPSLINYPRNVDEFSGAGFANGYFFVDLVTAIVVVMHGQLVPSCYLTEHTAIGNGLVHAAIVE